ncbi:MAG: tetratricopeptide repeat protein [Acidobacteriota bacterium]|nr:tetratricopeptide repeat protein [Acidobacteriota bacterium]
MTAIDRNSLGGLRRCISATLIASLGASALLAQHGHGSEGVGKAHMETSCAPAVQARFDRALAVLHNFWYARAFTQFQEIQKADPDCAMAYWGAAMTYNHPFWDNPSQEDEAAAWAYVQKGLKARSQNDREHMYLEAVAALYQDAGAGTKQSRDEAYREQMAATHAKYHDDETTLFYGLSVLSTIREGTKGFEMQGRAVALFESVYAHDTQHPGVLHYLIHAYDDPVHAKMGLAAARAYAKTAAAVPHAYHMPSHIFTRLGYWDEAATTNENAWQISNDDVKAAGEPGTLRDFHALNYLSYNYLQLGRYKDAKKAVDLFAAQYAAITNRQTAPESQDLQARHVRGRTIFALPDRVLYGYFDTLARFIVESESWSDVPNLPLIAPSSDFVVMKLHLEAMAAAKRKDAATVKTKAAEMMERARVPGQHPFVQQILTIQAREAAALAARAADDAAGAVTEMDAAVAIEDSIDSLSQPPYPIIPAHELYGSMLMDMGRPAEARKHFEETLRRTPGRPKAIVGIAQAAEAMGDTATARAQYARLIEMWKSADRDRPELQAAQRFLRSADR